MLPDPLHPAVVHFPIALGALLPLAIAWSLFQSRREHTLAAWIPALAIAILLAATATFASRTGDDQEAIVEEVVAHDVIHEHEEAGELLQRVAIGLALLLAIGLIPAVPDKVALGFRVAALIASIVLVPLVLRAGKTGAALVYEHGAASAYTEDVGN